MSRPRVMPQLHLTTPPPACFPRGWFTADCRLRCCRPRGPAHYIPVGGAVYFTGQIGVAYCPGHAPISRAPDVEVMHRAPSRTVAAFCVVQVEGVVVADAPTHQRAEGIAKRLRRALQGFRKAVPRP